MKATTFAYRGMGLEAVLDLAHDLYAKRGVALIRHYHLAARYRGGRQGASLVALQKDLQPVDYHGCVAGRMVVFDAKETKDRVSWSLDRAYGHQIERLYAWSRFGALAFFAIECAPRHTLFLVRTQSEVSPFGTPVVPIWPRCDFEVAVAHAVAGMVIVPANSEGWYDWLPAVQLRGWLDT
jgi:penicillin-binding protein-related factor A (putative recombinase)